MKDNSELRVLPSNPPGIDAQTTLAKADSEAGRVTESKLPQYPNLSQKLWNDAYDSLEKDEDKLVKAYVKALTKSLENEKATDASDISTELQDRNKRQMYMEKLVEKARQKSQRHRRFRKESVTSPKPFFRQRQ